MDVRIVNLKQLARDLYQTGLDLGLTPDEAARLTATITLPAWGTSAVAGGFENERPEGRQERPGQRLHNLVQKPSVG